MYQENENSFGIPKIAQSSNYYKSISKIIFSPQTVRYNCRLIKKKGDIYRPWYYFGFSKVRQMISISLMGVNVKDGKLFANDFQVNAIRLMKKLK